MSRELTVEQVAQKLQMTADCVREHLRSGRIPGRKVGRSWQIAEADLDSWISSRQDDSTERVSARSFLRQFPGSLSAEDFMQQKHAETEEEEDRHRRRFTPTSPAP